MTITISGVRFDYHEHDARGDTLFLSIEQPRGDPPDRAYETPERRQGLRALSRNGDPQPLIRVLDFAQAYAAAIDWSDLKTAERMLEETNAFVEPEPAEERGARLRLPSR